MIRLRWCSSCGTCYKTRSGKCPHIDCIVQRGNEVDPMHNDYTIPEDVCEAAQTIRVYAYSTGVSVSGTVQEALQQYDDRQQRRQRLGEVFADLKRLIDLNFKANSLNPRIRTDLKALCKELHDLL